MDGITDKCEESEDCGWLSTDAPARQERIPAIEHSQSEHVRFGIHQNHGTT
jgi:hypothetical protein